MNGAPLHYVAMLAASLLLAPLLPGIISRVKAIAAGRHGKPILQTYYDIWKLARKGEVISSCATWPAVSGPSTVLASGLLALALLPLGGVVSPLGFAGDFILAAYLLGLSRFALMLSALDTGSSFEGMGASREAAFGALAEPAMFLTFFALSSFCLDAIRPASADTGAAFSLGAMFCGQSAVALQLGQPQLLLAPVIFFILLIAENCRIPVDDPTTHLELTMIHEVMILDQSGPNLAMLLYASSIKLWFFSALIAALIVPPLPFVQALLLWLAVIFLIALLVGIVESVMARLRMPRVPHLLGMAALLSILALILAQVS